MRIFRSPFSLKTLQGKLVWAVLMVAVLMLTVNGLFVYQVDQAVKENKYYLEVVKPVKFYAAQHAGKVNLSFTYLLKYKEHNYQSFRERYNELLTQEARQSIDSLNILSKRLKKADSKDIINSMEGVYYKLKDSYNLVPTLSPDEQNQYINEKINSYVDRMNLLASELIEIEQKQDETLYVNFYNNIWDVFMRNSWMLILVVVVVLIAGIVLVRGLAQFIGKLQESLNGLSHGETFQHIHVPKGETRRLFEAISLINNNLINIQKFANDIAAENFNSTVKVFNDKGAVGEALKLMKEKLAEVHESEETRIWQAEGRRYLAEVIRENSNIDIKFLCESLLQELIKYVHINQGGIFLHNEKDELLELVACFAYDRLRYEQRIVNDGEGLLSEVLKDGKTMVLTDIPEDYIFITSGLGQAVPTSLAILPLKYQGQVIGVMELASFEVFTEKELELVEQVSQVLTANILNTRSRQKTEELLLETQGYLKKLNTQEEELRQSTEELMATREGLEEKVHYYEKIANLFDALMQVSNLPLMVLDEENRIKYASSSLHELVGGKQERYMDFPVFGLIPTLKEILKSYTPDSDPAKWHEVSLHTFKHGEMNINVSVTCYMKSPAFTFVALLV